MTVEYLGIAPIRRAVNSLGSRSYTRGLLFQTSLETENEWHVGSAAEVPPIGSVHPDDPNAYLREIIVENTDPKFGWTVTLNYNDERQLNEDPTADPAVTDWDGEQFQRPLVIDEDGNLVCNSAGDPFDPPEMIDDSRLISTTIKNMSVVPTWIMQYANAVNSDAFTLDGFPVEIGQAKMQRPRVSRQQWRNGISFREVVFTINYREEGWLSNLLDAGFRELQSGVLVNILNAGDNEEPSAPVPLNGSGVSLANPSPTNNVNLTFRAYRRLPFSILPLT